MIAECSIRRRQRGAVHAREVEGAEDLKGRPRSFSIRESAANILCTIMVYTDAMSTTKQVRRSVTLPAQIAQQVDRLAKRRRLSDNRVLVELIEQGIEAAKQKEQAFFELADASALPRTPARSRNRG